MNDKSAIALQYDDMMDEIGNLIVLSSANRHDEFNQAVAQVMDDLVDFVEQFSDETDAYAAVHDLFFMLVHVMEQAAPWPEYTGGRVSLILCNRMLLLASGFLGEHYSEKLCASLLSSFVNQTCIRTLDFRSDNVKECDNDAFATYYVFLKSAVKSCSDNLKRVDPTNPLATHLQRLIDEHDPRSFQLRDIPPAEMLQVFLELQPYFDEFMNPD